METAPKHTPQEGPDFAYRRFLRAETAESFNAFLLTSTRTGALVIEFGYAVSLGHARRLAGGKRSVDQFPHREATDDVFISLWDKRPNPNCKILSYVYRAIYLRLLTLMNRANAFSDNVPVEILDILGVAVGAPDSPMPSSKLQARIDKLMVALNTLPARQRYALTRRYLDGAGIGEIATEMACSRNNVTVLCSRGTRALRLRLS